MKLVIGSETSGDRVIGYFHQVHFLITIPFRPQLPLMIFAVLGRRWPIAILCSKG